MSEVALVDLADKIGCREGARERGISGMTAVVLPDHVGGWRGHFLEWEDLAEGRQQEENSEFLRDKVSLRCLEDAQ